MTVIELSMSPGGDGPEDLLYIDDLTGIYNRRFYTRRFAEEAERAVSGDVPLAMALVDIDYFKSVNDSYGHQVGDRILRHVGETMKARCREAGAIPIRYGGDEFLILFPGAQRDAALAVMELIADDVRGAKIETSKAGLVSVTVSVGVASLKEDCDGPDELFQAADRAVYRAKEDGRNRVSIPPSAEAVLFSKDDFHRLFPCPRLIGRHDMLNEVKKHLRLGGDTVRPVIVLEGPSGVGKSRLLEAAKGLMDTQRTFLLHARGQPYLVNQPYGAIVDALRILIRSDARLAQRVSAYLSAAEIGAIYPLIPDVAGLHLAPDEQQAPPRQNGRRLVTTAILKMLISAADGKPMNIIVDDLHWCDAGTVEVLAELKTTAPGRSSLIVVAMRKTGEVVGESNKAVMDYIVDAAPNRILLPVEPLSYAEVREMMAAILPGLERHHDLVQIVSQKSQALPLLVEEILKFLIQKCIIESKAGQVQVNSFAARDIPGTIHDILQQRALSLDEEVRNMVSTASVVGSSFDVGLLQALEERNEGELLGAIEKGVRTSLIRADSADAYRFTSDDAQQAIYDQVDESTRTDLHMKVAELEEQRNPQSDAAMGRLAYHYQKAGRQERAIHLFRRLQQEYEQAPAAVAGLPPPTVVPDFVSQITSQLDVQVRDLESGDLDKITNAVLVLLAAGDRAIEPLMGLVLSSDDLRARRLALQCLHRVTKGVVQRLLEELYRTQNYEEKCRVISALGEYQNSKVTSELASYARFHDASVRRAALKVLEASHEVFALEVLRAALTDSTEGVAQDAVSALGRMGMNEVVPDLIQMVRKRTIFASPRRHAPQRGACLALGAIGDRRAVPVLIGILRHSPFYTLMRNKTPEVRAAAAMALANFPGDDTLRALEQASHDHSHVIRSAAKVALTKLKGGLLVADPENLDELLPALPLR